MKLQELQRAVNKAQQSLQTLELKALGAEKLAKAAKEKARQLKREHRYARKAAKQAKRLAAEAQAQAQGEACMLAKAEKRLTKALRQRAEVALGNGKAARPPVAPQPRPARKGMAPSSAKAGAVGVMAG